MKTLRRFLIGLAAPSALLLGLTQLGGTPIYKGYNTGFTTTAETSQNSTLTITTDAGDLTCWVKLRLPFHSQDLSAKLSTGTPLYVYQHSMQDADQWVAIVADSQKPEEKFNWPSGAILFLTSTNGGGITPNDWQIYLSEQAFDSKSRARWRNVVFGFSIFFLLLSLAGVTLEALQRHKDERIAPFTHEDCLNRLIMSSEGSSSEETEWMRSILRKVLLQTVPVGDALAPIPLPKNKKLALWFKTRKQFRLRLERLITDLNRDLESISDDIIS
jgi:hypothetical protein